LSTCSRGVAIYRTFASPYWLARIWDPRAGRYAVRSTKETGKLKARDVAEEIAGGIKGPNRSAPPEFSFKSYATKTIARGRQLVESGERNANYIRTTQLFLDNDDWGLVRQLAIVTCGSSRLAITSSSLMGSRRGGRTSLLQPATC
jgi:hypothetical protein